MQQCSVQGISTVFDEASSYNLKVERKCSENPVNAITLLKTPVN